MERATKLTVKDIAVLRERAAKEAGSLVDVRLIHKIRIHNSEWASEILGFPFPGQDRLIWEVLYLLHLASQAEPTPPPPPQAAIRQARYAKEEAEREAQAAEKYQQEWAEWQRLKAALEAAGTRVTVRHNYTSSRHVDGYTQGADHIYLLQPLTLGRLHRKAHTVLCWTPSRAKDLQYFPVEGQYDDRIPTDQACLKTARSIAERTA